jgi:hypothetical protein
MPFTQTCDFKRFCEIAERESRYLLNIEAAAFIEAVKDTMLSRASFIGENDCGYWRAQVDHKTWDGYDREGNPDSCPEPFSSERMKPTHEFASHGRANPKGIPYLYLSNSKETAMAEMRPWKDALISCAQFKTTRQLRIIDCSVRVGEIFSPATSPEERTRSIWRDIDNAFSKPIATSDEHVKYVPTQILAELFKTSGFDGVTYKSSLGEGFNTALFDLDAANVFNRQLFQVTGIHYSFDERSGYLTSDNQRPE